MQAVLTQINAMPGIMGSMLCDEDGALQAHLFPSLFDVSLLQQAAGFLADSASGLEEATGEVGLIDLRYREMRVVVRPMPKAFLLLLCNRSVNMQLLGIGLNVAAKKLEKQLAAQQPQAPQRQDSVPTPAAGSVAAPTMVTINIAGREKAIKGVSLTVQAVKKTANTHWDNMLETVAVNRSTAIQISDCFDTGSFKKLKLTNPANGCSKKFPVRIIRDDVERIFEGKVVITQAIMEALLVKPGDTLVAQVDIGGGFLGWEGI